MPTSRREFLKRLGIVLATLVLTRCTPATQEDEDDWDCLRRQWMGLDRLAWDTRLSNERGEKTRDRLIADHHAALDNLVQAGELDLETSDDIHVAFKSAASHVWSLSAPVSCYFTPLLDPYLESVDDLTEQAKLLIEISHRSNIDPETIAQAQAAIERDIAFLSTSANNYHTLSGTDTSVEAGYILVEVLLDKK